MAWCHFQMIWLGRDMEDIDSISGLGNITLVAIAGTIIVVPNL